MTVYNYSDGNITLTGVGVADELIFQDDVGGSFDFNHFSFRSDLTNLYITSNNGSIITITDHFLNDASRYETLIIGVLQLDLSQASVIVSEVAGADISGTSEDDLILLDSSHNTSIQGYEGNDIIFGFDHHDSIDGGDGDDYIYGGGGGGGGGDTLTGGLGNDYIDGGEGEDSIHYRLATQGVYVNLEMGVAYDNGYFISGTNHYYNTIDTLISFKYVSGSDFSDEITGNDEDNNIDGYAGDDIFYSSLGSDDYYGGDGIDTVSYINSGAAVTIQDGDSAGGDAEGDYYYHDIENITGSSFDDTIVFNRGGGNNILNGGAGNDYLYSVNGDDVYIGGEGNDEFYYHEGNKFIIESFGIDRVTFSGIWQPHHVLIADNTISFTNSAYTIQFNDITLIEEFAFDGYAVMDLSTLLANSPSSMTIDGDEFDNILNGYDGDNIIRGYEGNDTIYGKGGNDYIRGEEGEDYIDGGVGNDNLRGEGDDDEIYGGDGDDEIRGGDGDDLIDGGAGTDKLRGGLGNDEIHGGDGDDTDFLGEEGDDILYGGDGDDKIYGDDKNGLIAGNDILDGGEGNDDLRGGVGNDTYIASSGDDYIYDIGGNDRIVFGEGISFWDLSFMVDPLDTNDLIISYGSNSIHIENQLSSQEAGVIERIELFDGGFITLDNFNNWLFSDLSTPKSTLIGGLSDDVLIHQGDRLYSRMLYGAEGNDILFGLERVALFGGDGDDLLYAGRVDDPTFDGNSALFSGLYSDHLIIGNTVTDLVGNGGMDTLINIDRLRFYDGTYENGVFTENGTHGGSIRSTEYPDVVFAPQTIGVSYTNSEGRVFVDFVQNKGHWGYAEGDLYFNIVKATGSEYNDILIGSPDKDNTLNGWRGDDIYVYNGGQDQIQDDIGSNEVLVDNNFMPQDIVSFSQDSWISEFGISTTQYYEYNFVFEQDVNSLRVVITDNSILKLTFTDGFFIDLTNIDVWYFDTDGDHFDENGNPYNKVKILQGDNDVYQAGSGENYIHGGNGEDTLYGGNLNDVIFGGEGNDSKLNGKEGNDIIDGGEGDDTDVRGGAGDDILRGGAGNDRLLGDDANNVGVIVGNDILDGGEGDDELYGGLGNDTYLASEGSDYLYDLGGIDSLIFGENWSIYDLTFARDAVDTNDQDIFFGENQIHIENQTHSSGDYAVETLEFYDGSFTDYTTILDWVFANDTGEIIQGSYHRDDTIIGGDGNDKLYGKDGDDYLFGGLGDDYLRGDNGNDVIHGGDGNDNLRGFADDDLLYAGAGQDRLEGHGGADQFIFFGQEVIDSNLNRVVDFTATDGDVIRLENILEGYDPMTDSINDFIQMSTTGHTYLDIDIDGAGVNHGFVEDVIRIEHTGGDWTDAQDMIDEGHLIIA